MQAPRKTYRYLHYANRNAINRSYQYYNMMNMCNILRTVDLIRSQMRYLLRRSTTLARVYVKFPDANLSK
jgi:hypothetical protein